MEVGSILLLCFPDLVLGSRTLVISHAGKGIGDSRCKGKPLPEPTAMHKNPVRVSTLGSLLISVQCPPATVDR
jgi:hypothetical protein